MTENQKKLMPYVEAKTDSIIEKKQRQRIVPELATEPEIIADIRSDVFECMNELHKSGRYQLTPTLNYPALEKINND